MIDMGNLCMYEVPIVGAMSGCATTLHGNDDEDEADRRVRELRESILGPEPSQAPRSIGFVRSAC